MGSAGYSGRYVVNAPDVVAEDFDGRTVILNLANGHYFSLEGAAARIWELVAAGFSFSAIGCSFATRRPELADSAATFLQQLVEHRLVRVDPAPADASPIDEAWSGEAPRMTVYTDLAELIYADPIHEVDDQMGWPERRKDE